MYHCYIMVVFHYDWLSFTLSLSPSLLLCVFWGYYLSLELFVDIVLHTGKRMRGIKKVTPKTFCGTLRIEFSGNGRISKINF